MPAEAILPRAIAIGGSHGGFDQIQALLPKLGQPKVPILLCLHLPVGAGQSMAQVLSNTSAIPVIEAEPCLPLEPNTAYLAPGGYHTLVERDHSLSLSRDGPVNHAEPSIDVLFESAAHCYGRGLLAVLLSGASSDGALGLQRVHTLGGHTLVQQPETAKSQLMPESALALFTPTEVAAPQKLPELINNWLKCS